MRMELNCYGMVSFVLIVHIYLWFYVSGVSNIGKNSIIFTVNCCCCYSGATCPSPFLPCASSLEQTVISTASDFKFQTAILSLFCVIFRV
jgi:hypothetical protein